MPVEPHALLRDLQPRVRLLEDDLRQRIEGPDGADQRSALVEEHRRAVASKRTSAAWLEFRDEQVTQAAVAWVLATVFSRFCEDNDLVPDVWIAGPGARTRLAAERQQAFLVTQPVLNDRDWLLAAFDHLASYPALAALLDHEHNPLHRLSISADAAENLLGFWRQTGDEGELVHDLTDPDLSTRFLGDLYQDLSETARSKYALLQTPEFIEEFILDQTLEPALAERPLKDFRVIDPTCGSGHFLLGAFKRLVDRWSREAPALDLRERVQRALDAVHGVDINPFAVAIARYRLTLAAMKADGTERLSDAPAYRFHLAVGDSLLHGSGTQTLLEDVDLTAFAYSAESANDLKLILEAGRYDAVVGNPPYITVEDKTLNLAYRQRYASCKGTYALSVPFMERFFQLGRRGGELPAGWIGQITSNSFMKKDFGSRLIDNFLAHRDLRQLVDTSGVHIPGHGTPTVIVVGRNQPASGRRIRAVMGSRGEPGRPEVPADGLVWTSIREHIASPGWSDEWISVVDAEEVDFAKHPWRLAGGAAADVILLLARDLTLADRISPGIGRAVRIGADDAFVRTRGDRSAFEDVSRLKPYLQGDDVRDWSAQPSTLVWYPYVDGQPVRGKLNLELWPNRVRLAARGTFQGDMADAGRFWWEYQQHTASAYRGDYSIAFSNISTHNHFGLNRGNTVFNAHAPVIKLRDGATEGDHLALLGVLNSSTACFWLKQHNHNKGNGGIGGGIGDEDWEPRYEYNGSTLKDLPLPTELPLDRARRLDALANQSAAASPQALIKAEKPTALALSEQMERRKLALSQLISEQEELDWEVYYLYGLIEAPMTYDGSELPGLVLGARAFEINLAREIRDGASQTAWFERHGSNPITEIPESLPAGYRDLVSRRLELIVNDPVIQLLESTEHKRRWVTEPWEKQEERALRGWLLDRLEAKDLWQDGAGRPQTQSIAQLADRLASDTDFLSVLELWSGHRAGEVQVELGRLLAEEHVPFLAAMRYRAPGLRKRDQWEHTWELQRVEDGGERVSDIPVPPKYTTADFVRTSYWKHRGKLDVPKERFISYPGAERGADQTLVLGWAGWDLAQQAQALASLTIARAQREGWDASRLTPLLAGLAELEPWLHQWHGQTDPRMGVSPAQAMTSTLDRELARLGLTRAELRAWRPQPATRGRRPRTTQEA